jgi:CxxC motif-containing protein (DUF1111 family)
MIRPFLIAALALVAPLLAVVAAGARAETPADGGLTVQDRSIEAFTQRAPAFARDSDAMRDGRAVFHQPWVIAPARDDAEFVGLGPVYNDISCGGCHVRNGRGNSPGGEGLPLHGALLRLSVPGAGPHGEPVPVPAYGEQLGDHAIPGVAAEGTVRVTYTRRVVTLADRTAVALRVPHVAVEDTSFGKLPPGTMLSLRIAQPAIGGALLEAIPEAEIRALADRQAAAGGPVHGHPNAVWDIASGRMVLGRLGWKANQPNLRQQAAAAANGDMGLTSVLFPEKNCPPVQTACAAAPKAPQPDLSTARLDALEAYLASLAVPAQRDADKPNVRHGAQLFAEAGCGACHIDSWRTGTNTAEPALSGQLIHPYTDLLLHDMGTGLADGRPDYRASGSEWRTAPLWGVGLTQTVNPNAGFLHDGRARTLVEAILWHGGEAEAARDAFAKSPAADRADLIAFLNNL